MPTRLEVGQQMSKDQIYTSQEAISGSFEFNDAVADVFPDMLRRSIPGYKATIDAIGTLAAHYAQPESHCYDLGCSLGAATLAMRANIAEPGCKIIAIDTSRAMVERCRNLIGGDGKPETTVIEADVRAANIENASMVVMNYTLQFLPTSDRLDMIRQIYDGMIEGGVFVLSEKVADADRAIENLLVDLHHKFKRDNAYTDLEISRKRSALENVLVPETTTLHMQRLSHAGFSHASVWLKHFNFVSIIAIK